MYKRFMLPDILLTATTFRMIFAPLSAGNADKALLMLISVTLCWSGMVVVVVRGIPALL